MSDIDLKALRPDAVELHRQAVDFASGNRGLADLDLLAIAGGAALLLPLIDRAAAAERRAEEAEKERDALQIKYTRAAAMAPIHGHRKAALDEWFQKTEFVQDRISVGLLPVKYLGWHRADVLRDLVADMDALRKDAERYRWMRTPPNNLRDELFSAGSLRWLRRDTYLDTAIDAAMAQEGGK